MQNLSRHTVRWGALVTVLVLAVQLGAIATPLPLLGGRPAYADPTGSAASPPAAVNPTPSVVVVSTPGPTAVPAQVTTDTVWGPLGSPYVITGSVQVVNRASLTLLPGTVVKFDHGASLNVNTGSHVLSLGTPNQHVVFTSLRDDTVLGDTNGDGSATVPARGDWNYIQVVGDPAQPVGGVPAGYESSTNVFDYSDLRYGGGPFDDHVCRTYGEITTAGGPVVRLVVSNSTFSDALTDGISITIKPDPRARVGIYNSTFARSGCGVGYWNGSGGPVDVVGNTFAGPFENYALVAIGDQQKTRAWFNTIQGKTSFAGATVPVTRAQADVRYNALLGGIGGVGEQDLLVDWSSNWYGRDANQALPTCLDPDAAASYYPALTTTNSASCPSGQVKVSGYKQAVTPSLSGSPQVLPASLREAAAPRFGPVNTYSGALTYQSDDMLVQDAGKALDFARTYQSNKPGSGDAGTGWSTAYSESMSQLGGVATMRLADGQSVDFATDPAAGYTPAPGVSADYSKGASGTSVRSPDATSYQFDATGQLTSMSVGDDGHQLSIQRSGGQVSKVTGTSGRYLSYARSDGKVTGVSDGNGRAVSFGYTGAQMSSATGVDGQTEHYGYDGSGRLTSVTTPAGRAKLAASYHSDGRVAWIEQAGHGRTTFGYDDAHSTRTATVADGTVLTQEYDFAGRLVAEHMGSTGTHVVYDGEGRTVATIGGVPLAPMTGYGPSAPVTMYDLRGDAVLTVDAMGVGTGKTYNNRHQVLVETRTDGSTVTNTYDGQFHLTQVTDPLGKVSRYTYNGQGQLISRTDPLGRGTTLAYAGNGDVTSVTDPSGATTTLGYDALGRRTSTTDPLGAQTQVSYTSWDQPWQVKQPRGGTTTLEFNADRQQTKMTDPAGGMTVSGYDSAGRLVSTVDAGGGTTTTTYDTLGRPTTTTDPRGSVTQRSYTAEGWLASTTDPDHNVTSYTYDPAGRTLRLTDALGQVTQTAYNRSAQTTDIWTPDGAHTMTGYDQMGRQSTTTTPRGYVSSVGYDAAGRLVSTKDALGYPTQVGYDDAGRVVSSTNQAGTVTNYSYDEAHRTVTVTDALGTVSISTRDAAGHTVSSADGNGAVTVYAYDTDGDIVRVTTPTGTATAEYDLTGRLTATVDGVGRRATTTYDALGRTTGRGYADATTESSAYDPDGNLTSHTDRTGATSTATYDPANNLLSTTDPLGHRTAYTYDPLNRRSSTTDPTGVVSNTAYDPVGRPAVRFDVTNASWVTAYDLDGNVASTTDPAGVVVTYTWDKRDQLASIQRPSQGSVWTCTYDAAGRLTRKVTGYATNYEYDIRGRTTAMVDGLGNRTTTGYDGAGNPTSRTSPGGHATNLTYDGSGRLTSTTDPTGDTTSYGYDAGGQLTSLTLPRGGRYAYTYDNAGHLATQSDPLQAVTRYTYDGEDRPTSIAYPSGRTVSATYDAAGRRTGQSAGGLGRTFSYDDAGRLTGAAVSGSGGNAPNLAYSYDNRGLLVHATDASGTTGYAYDDARRLTTKTPPTGVATTYTYNDRGLLATVRGPTNVNYTYNAASQVSAKQFVAPSRAANFGQQYDSAGRPKSISDLGYVASLTYTADGQVATVTRGTSKVTSYGYDDAGRITSNAVTDNGTAVSNATYTWDADGNRASVTNSGAPTVTATYNLADRLTATSDGATYAYDADGNQTRRGGTTYGYDSFGQLATATTPGAALSYARDAMGRTTTRTNGAVNETITYDALSGQVGADQQGTNPAVNLVRTPGGRLLAEAPTGSTTKSVGLDAFGSATTVQDDTGTTVRWQSGYDPFGNPISTTGTSPAPIGYQANYTDSATGLVTAGTTNYDPTTATDATPAAAPAVWGYRDPSSALLAIAARTHHDVTAELTSPDAGRSSGPRPIAVQLNVQRQQTRTVTRTQPAVDPLAAVLGAAVAGTAAAVAAMPPAPKLQKFVYHNDCQGLFDSVSNFVDNADGCADNVASMATQAAKDIGNQICEVCTKVVTAVAPVVASIVVGGAVFLGCEAITAGVGSVLCATAAGMAGGAVYGGMTCPEGRATWECVAEGVVVGGLSGATGGIATELGAGALLTGAVTGMVGDGAQQLITTGTIDPKELLTATAVGGFLGWGASKIPGLRGTRAANDDPAAGPTTRPAKPNEDPALANRRSTRSAPDRCTHSFDPTTPVLMADGSRKAIGDVKVGDKVEATDPATGKVEPRTVTALHNNDDTDLTDLTVKTGDGRTALLHTTQYHPFWDSGRNAWVDAAGLARGERLRTADGSIVTVVDVRSFAGRHQMRDLTVDELHTYYVIASNTPVLVHNCGEDDLSGHATIHLDRENAHASIEVTHEGTTIHSEQVGATGMDAVGSFFRGNLSEGTIPIRIPLPNAARAQAFQRATEDYVFGAYDLETRSCVTYCLDVLRAGGVEGVPDASVGWRRSTLWIFSRDN